LDQWREDCIEFGYSPILCGSSHNNWRIKLRSAITDFKLSASDLCIIAVHKTASDHPFIDAVSKIPSEQIMLIADEVHGLGSGVLKNALRDEYEMRLGLSATPSRWYDESGTAVLLNYFNSICFQFTLRDAIPEYLVEYRYEPNLVYLTALEENRIGELSALIGRLSSKKGAAGLDELEQRMLEKALRDRASVVKKAENKLLVLRDRLRSLRASGETFKHSLFYSPESQHLDVLRVLRDDGIPAHQFIGEDVPKERRKILDDFDKGRISSLVAMKCLDEGVDVPATKTAFFIASTTNPKEFIQRRGRVLRKAKGKKRANIYDFIVVPSPETPEAVAQYLLEREMPRFAEFSDLAENKYRARDVLRPILDRYEMLHLLDLKPWDVYHRQNPESRDQQ
jgi:superfamily II DNA or RNA helicase